MIELKAEKSRLWLVKTEPVVSGQVDTIDVKIDFSRDWDGLKKTIVFRSGREARDVLLLDNATQCKVPWEVVSRPGGTLRIGVYGIRGSETVLPTVWCDVGRIVPGAEPAGNTSAQYEMDTFARIVDLYEGARNVAQSVRDDADAGKFNGRAFTYEDFTEEQLAALTGPQGPVGQTGPQGVQGVPGPAGSDGKDGTDGKDGADGVIWTPAVSSDGTLSWTNDGGLDNPSPVNLMGPQGPSGARGPQGEAGPAGPQGETGPQGPKGDTPYIGENEHWFVGTTDTGVSANGLPGEAGPRGETGSPGADGVTFTPSVSEDGMLSWENNGGMANPEPVSIRGPNGDTGATGATGAKGEQGERGPQGEQGEQGIPGPAGPQGEAGPAGPQGEQGPAGADGYTPQRGVDYWTAADKQDIVNDVLAALPTWTGGSY